MKIIKLNTDWKADFRVEKDFEKYEILSEISTGGMGKVFLANDKTVDRKVALKILHEDLQKDPEARKRFIEEAKITGKLEHSNIVPVHSLGLNEEEKLYFTMKYVDGDSLLKVISQLTKGNEDYRRHYTEFMLLSIFRKVCDAVSYAHSKSVLHRDIKPENIMVSDYGEVLLMDWGIAKFVGQEGMKGMTQMIDLNHLQTRDDIIKGSPAYMSPEQAEGPTGEFDVRSDIFLLGATLYHMLTLKAPYYNDDYDAMIKSAANNDFRDPAKVNPDVELSDELCDIICKAMARNKKDRYQTVEKLAAAIDDYMSGLTISDQIMFKAGTEIITQGEDGTEAYVILKGEVEVYKRFGGEKTVFTRLHPGDVFGEMSSITDTKTTACVAALTDIICLRITPENLKKQLCKLEPWLEKVFKSLSTRVREMDAISHPLLVNDCVFEVSNQIRMLMMCYGDVRENFLQYDLRDITFEVSNNLKIPEERVRPIIAGLTEIGLAEISTDLYLQIPNWHLFNEFVDFLKHEQSSMNNKELKYKDVH